MRVTFPRLPDHQRGYALVERDDGVVYRLDGSDKAGPGLPHDLRHLVVERELRICDGIWGGIAAGVVFTSMRHVSGRRPPHAAGRSRELLRDFRERGLRAELMADLVASVAALDRPSGTRIRRLAAEKLCVLPDAEVDPVVIVLAAQTLQVEASRWARLRVGEELSYDWPRPGPEARRARQDAPGIVRPDQRGRRRMTRSQDTAAGRPPEVITRGPVTLRRHREGDLEAVYTAVTESADHLRPWTPWAEGYTRERAAEFLAHAAQAWEQGTEYGYAITTGGALAGGASLMARIGPGGLEIGYWVHRAHTRRGLATAAAAALTGQAFRLPGIERVEIVTDELNLASAGVPRKLGFTEVGRRLLELRAPAGTGTGVVWRKTR